MRIADPGILFTGLGGGRGRREVADPLEVMNDDDRVKQVEDTDAARPSVLELAGVDDVLSREETFGLEVLRPNVREVPESTEGRCGPLLLPVADERGIGFGDSIPPLVNDSLALKRGVFAVRGTRRAPPRRPVVAKLFVLIGVGFEEVETDSRLTF